MKLIPAKTPGFVTALLPNFIWNIDTNKKELFLTFDDGPTPEITPWVLEQLNQYHAKATFFCIGRNIEKHPDIFEAILKNQHAVGNHTHNHLNGWKASASNYLSDTNTCQKVLQSAIVNRKSSIKLFRPPYGKLKPSQAKQLKKLGYKIVMWDVLSFDWDASIAAEECFNNVINSAEKGSIIVMHDSVKASKNLKVVLPRILDYYSKLGFEFKTINY